MPEPEVLETTPDPIADASEVETPDDGVTPPPQALPDEDLTGEVEPGQAPVAKYRLKVRGEEKEFTLQELQGQIDDIEKKGKLQEADYTRKSTANANERRAMEARKARPPTFDELMRTDPQAAAETVDHWLRETSGNGNWRQKSRIHFGEPNSNWNTTNS